MGRQINKWNFPGNQLFRIGAFLFFLFGCDNDFIRNLAGIWVGAYI